MKCTISLGWLILPWLGCLFACQENSGGSVEQDAATPQDTDAETDSGDDAGVDADSDLAPDTDIQYWEQRVDAFWGEAPETTVRLEVFDGVWEDFAQSYACFDSNDVDWDKQRDHYRPLVEAATSYGRFVQLLNEMVSGLKDSHSILDSSKVCSPNPTSDRPPRFQPLHNLPRIGGCVTLDEEDNLLVYRRAETNPLDLEVGDIIVGLNGKSWQENLEDTIQWRIPFCEDWGSTEPSLRYNKACALPNNPHLFQTIEVLRAETGRTESYPLKETIETNPSYELCSDQLPVPGVALPFDDWTLLDNVNCSNCLSYGLIEGTNIGYINVIAWYGDALDDFQDAIEALYDTTEALIVDQRFNPGGVKTFIEYGFPILFDQSIDPLLTFHYRDDVDDYFSLAEYDVMSIIADPDTFYDHPIAILTGPKAGSGGDMCPYALAHHPRARSFGRPTNGAFGETRPFWGPDPFLDDLIGKASVGQAFDVDGRHLQGMVQSPDEEVWLTRDDVMAGVDTVLEAARTWIDLQNAQQ